jgi:hypothetical protein
MDGRALEYESAVDELVGMLCFDDGDERCFYYREWKCYGYDCVWAAGCSCECECEW